MIRVLAIAFMISLAGCSVASTVPMSESHSTLDNMAPSGGAFTANYAGTGAMVGSSCSSHFDFSGTGSGTFVGKGSESGSMHANMFTSCHWVGSATLVSKRHPANSITVSLSSPLRFGPCDVGAGWVVTSGTGKFIHAAGNGRIKFHCNQNGTYSDVWSGTLNF